MAVNNFRCPSKAEGCRYAPPVAILFPHHPRILGFFSEQPTISFVPAIDTLERGKTVTVSCTANFASPHEVDMTKIPDIIPKLSLWIGGQRKGDASTEWSETIGVASKLLIVSKKSCSNHVGKLPGNIRNEMLLPINF